MAMALASRLTSALTPASSPISVVWSRFAFLRTPWFRCWLFLPSWAIRVFNFGPGLQNRIYSTLLLSIYELSLLEVIIRRLLHNNDSWVPWLLSVCIINFRERCVLALFVRQIALIQVDVRLACVWNIVLKVGTLFASAIHRIPTILNTWIILLHHVHSTEHSVRIVAKTLVSITKISCLLLLRAHNSLILCNIGVEAKSLSNWLKFLSCWNFSPFCVQRLLDHLKPILFSFFQMLLCFFLNLFISLSLSRSLRKNSGGLDICSWGDWVNPCSFCFWGSMRWQTLSLRCQTVFAFKRFAWFDWFRTWLI